MKKIEVVVDNAKLDRFKSAAAELGIVEFEVSIVELSSSPRIESERLYRGRPFSVDFVTRSKVEFVAPDEDVKSILHVLLTTLQPENVSIFKIDKAILMGRTRLSQAWKAA